MAKYWTTKEGKEIRISEISNSHLLNTIAMLERQSKIGVERVISYGFGDNGNFETGEVEILEGKEYLESIKEYKWLKDEAKKRGI